MCRVCFFGDSSGPNQEALKTPSPKPFKNSRCLTPKSNTSGSVSYGTWGGSGKLGALYKGAYSKDYSILKSKFNVHTTTQPENLRRI